MALSQKQVAQLAKEQERLNKLQEDFYAAQEAGNKKAIAEAARLMKLTNGRIDKLGKSNEEADKYYNTLKNQLDISGEITKATQDRATLLTESNNLAQLEAGVGKQTARQQEIQGNAAQKLFSLKQSILGVTNAEELANANIEGLKSQIARIEQESVEANREGSELINDTLDGLRMQVGNLEEQQEYLQAENQLRDATIGKLESMKGGMTRMITQAKLFTKALMANPIFLLAAVIVGLIALMKKFVTDTLALRDGLGASVEQSARLNAELQGARLEAMILGYDVNAIAGELQETFGTLEGITGDTIKTLGRMEKSLGIASKDAAAVAREFSVMSGESFETGINFVKTTASLAEANKVAPGAVMKDIADNAETFAEFGADGGENIAKAAVQARKLGVNLATTAKIANSLLDFESSIEKEMEASMMIGKQLNFNRARELALSGDIAGATTDIVKQLGGASEIQKMNVLQRRALADSIGVSVDELNRLATGKVELLPPEKSIEEMLLDKMQQLIEALEKFKTFVKDMGNTIVEYSKNILDQVFGESGLGASIKSMATKLFDDIKKIFGGEGDFGYKVGQALGVSIAYVVENLPTIMLQLIKGLSNGLILVFTTATDFLFSVSEGLMNTLGSFFGFGTIGTYIVDIFRSLRDGFVSVFANIMQFIIDKIYGFELFGFSIASMVGDKPTIAGSYAEPKTVAEFKGDETAKHSGMLKQEMNDLTSEQQTQLTNAIATGQMEALEKVVGARTDQQSIEMQQMIDMLQMIAKNTGMTTQEVVNLTKE